VDGYLPPCKYFILLKLAGVGLVHMTPSFSQTNLHETSPKSSQYTVPKMVDVMMSDFGVSLHGHRVVMTTLRPIDVGFVMTRSHVESLSAALRMQME